MNRECAAVMLKKPFVVTIAKPKKRKHKCAECGQKNARFYDKESNRWYCDDSCRYDFTVAKATNIKAPCPEGDGTELCNFTPDVEYDPTNPPLNCERCGGYPSDDFEEDES